MNVLPQPIQCADLRKHGEILLAQLGYAQREILDGLKSPVVASLDQCLSHLSPQSSGVQQSEP